MPLYMDRHNTVGVTPEVTVASHVEDLAIQSEYGIRFITYWCDEDRFKAFCLADALARKRFRRPMLKPTEASPTKSIVHWRQRCSTSDQNCYDDPIKESKL